MTSKVISAAGIVALKQALTDVYWYKSDLRSESLGGHLKTGHSWTLQNRPPGGQRPRLSDGN
jgi:hypothetical protein